ncbi:sulfurtransferase complex subunit TusD [Telmatospirillum sp. J64-1]|uniref:sulfurtransferase complex subunit TusD n=1 Tax=Telmatospirillum sp. J64-1 TaxID=2502183 RepID=UPI00115CA49E|nr:sulfurtransferase complex subunit TusD [Telmatospirillum sp. J64-1]
MEFALVVTEGPFTRQSSATACRFARAAIARGHRVWRVFFFHDGVGNASRHIEPPGREHNAAGEWSALAREHGVDLVLCVTAAQRRGICAEALAPGFRIGGLGQMVEASIRCDRTLVFGG